MPPEAHSRLATRDVKWIPLRRLYFRRVARFLEIKPIADSGASSRHRSLFPFFLGAGSRLRVYPNCACTNPMRESSMKFWNNVRAASRSSFLRARFRLTRPRQATSHTIFRHNFRALQRPRDPAKLECFCPRCVRFHRLAISATRTRRNVFHKSAGTSNTYLPFDPVTGTTQPPLLVPARAPRSANVSQRPTGADTVSAHTVS